MFLSVIVMIIVFMILNHRGYEFDRILPIALLAGAVAYFIPFGAMIAWPFKILGGALGFVGGSLGAVAGGFGGLIGGILSIVTGAISLVLGLVGGVIGLVFGAVGLVIGIVFSIAIPLIIIWFIFRLVF